MQARQQHLLSNDHLTVDGTLLEGWNRSHRERFWAVCNHAYGRAA